jgi:hypothetical protein
MPQDAHPLLLLLPLWLLLLVVLLPLLHLQLLVPCCTCSY